jgi:hypothetical protein
MAASFALGSFQLVAANCLVFLAYRLLFLWAFADADALGDVPAVLLRGLRLDLALISLELMVVLAVAFATRHLRYRAALGALWAFTFANLLAVVANLLFFRERNQHLWEMLLANLGRPSEIGVALEPFFAVHPLLPLGLALATACVAAAARRHGRAFAGQTLDLWASPLRAALAVPAIALLFVTNLEVIREKGKSHTFRIGTIASKHYMSFADYVLNQAVINPLYDLVHYYGPAVFARTRYRLEAGEALGVSRALLGLQGGDERYPLLQPVVGEALGIRNVIILQVEGLGGAVLERRVADGWLTPYLRELAEEGLYFPNVYQSFGATDGSVFATATSLHRTFAVSDNKSNLFPYEFNGHFGCLSRVLGSEGYRHYFFAAFRQRISEFVSFMGNQGYEALGFDGFIARLGDRAEQESNSLGIFDGPMLREVADILAAKPGDFTAHVVTATSHSPWETPGGPSASFADPRLASFRYVDESIRAFVERLRVELPAFDRTLFVIVGDHTSITFGGGLVERIRVPLLLWGKALTPHRGRWADRQQARGSHVDILPTVLSLLEGTHLYGGMGRSLLGEATTSGIISSSHHDSLYIKDDFALRYTPHDASTELYVFAGERLLPRDVSEEQPEVVERLTREYLALYETSDRLTREKRVFPRGDGDERPALAAGRRSLP